MQQLVRGNTLGLRLAVRFEGNYVDATSCSCTITDPLRTKVVDGDAMVKQATGRYSYEYTSAATAVPGVYSAHCWATVGSKKYGDLLFFEVVER